MAQTTDTIHLGGDPVYITVAKGTVPIASEIESTDLVPGTTPFSTTNTEQALSILTDGQMSYGSSLGIEYDLWGADASQQYVDITADFGGVAEIRSLALFGFNMNSYYSMKSGTVSFVAADDTVTTANMNVGKDASGQTVVSFATDVPKLAKRITIRVYTGDNGAWKLNLTELQVNGKPPIRPAKMTSVAAAPGAAPFDSHNTSQAQVQSLLTDGTTDYGSAFGVEYDFWGVPAADQYAEVTVELNHEALIDGVRLDGFNLNSFYSIDHADIIFQAADGSTVTQQTVAGANTAGGSASAAYDAAAAPILAKRVIIRAYTGYTYPGTSQTAWKLNLTEVAVHAKPTDFAAFALTTGSVPFSSNNTDQAAALLTDGITDYGSAYGVEYDLWGAAGGQNYAEMTVDLGYEAQIRKLELDGFNLNGYYSIDHVDLTFEAEDATTVTATAAGSNTAGGTASAVYVAPSAPVKARYITIRAYTGYTYPGTSQATWKLNLTELNLSDQLKLQQ